MNWIDRMKLRLFLYLAKNIMKKISVYSLVFELFRVADESQRHNMLQLLVKTYYKDHHIQGSYKGKYES